MLQRADDTQAPTAIALIQNVVSELRQRVK